MSTTDEHLTDADLKPGKTCPECGSELNGFRARKIVDPDNIPDDYCWLPADDVEPTGLTTSFAGNVIILHHA